MGNIHSIKHALNYLGVESCYTKDDEVIKQSSKIILPGVGSYKIAMKSIKKSNLDYKLKEYIQNDENANSNENP